MPARALRVSLLVPAAGFALLGAVLFVAPGWAADRFPWQVSAFLVMTMGAWYLGTSLFAWTALADPHWPRMHPALLYVWLFSVGQASLLLVHDEVLVTDATLAWPYIAAVGAAGLAALAGIAATAAAGEWRVRGQATMPWPVVALVAAFVVAVAVLALPLVDGYDSPRSIWPGELTLLSARAFAVFFGALSLSAASILAARRFGPALPYLRAGIVLSALILVAALFHLGRFDFGDHPLQLLYVGLYVVVLVGSALLIRYASRLV